MGECGLNNVFLQYLTFQGNDGKCGKELKIRLSYYFIINMNIKKRNQTESLQYQGVYVTSLLTVYHN